jgi:hypothetical protein
MPNAIMRSFSFPFPVGIILFLLVSIKDPTLARRHGGPLQVCFDAVMAQLDRDCSGPSRVYSASLRSVRRERWSGLAHMCDAQNV